MDCPGPVILDSLRPNNSSDYPEKWHSGSKRLCERGTSCVAFEGLSDISGHISGAGSNPLFIDGREKPLFID